MNQPRMHKVSRTQILDRLFFDFTSSPTPKGEPHWSQKCDPSALWLEHRWHSIDMEFSHPQFFNEDREHWELSSGWPMAARSTVIILRWLKRYLESSEMILHRSPEISTESLGASNRPRTARGRLTRPPCPPSSSPGSRSLHRSPRVTASTAKEIAILSPPRGTHPGSNRAR